jgi:hypothetical protein
VTPARRTVVVTLPSGASPRAAMEAAVEFARLLGRPVRAVYVEEETILSVFDYPAPFRPAGARTPGTGGAPARGRMVAALGRQRRAFEAELGGLAVHARVEHSFAVSRGGGTRAVPREAGAGDLVVLPVALDAAALGRRLEEAAALAPRTGGVLMVPETRPARGGPVVALAAPGDRATEAAAARIAEGLGAPLSVVLAGQEEAPAGAAEMPVPGGGGGPGRVGLLRLAGGQTLDTETLGPAGLRLLVTRAEHLDRVALAGGGSAVRRHRPAILVLGDGFGGDEAETAAPGAAPDA